MAIRKKLPLGLFPSYFWKTRARCGKLEPVAPVAQWIRASVFGTEGRGFESLRVYQIGVSRFFVVSIMDDINNEFLWTNPQKSGRILKSRAGSSAG